MTRALSPAFVVVIAMFVFAPVAWAQKATPTPARAKTTPSVVHAIARTDLRLSPVSSAPTLEIIEIGESFDFGGFSRDGNWAKVRTALGTVGWIPKRDLRPGPAPDGTPTPHRDERHRDDELVIHGEAAYVLIDERVSSNEGHGYAAKIGGYGAGVRAERAITDRIAIEGGYLGSANQRMPAPQSPATVFSTLHRFDVNAKLVQRFENVSGEPALFGIAGVQNHSFLVQPQDLSWFYSQIYTSAALGAGVEAKTGRWRFAGDGRWLGPVLASERYGNGGAGGDGQRSGSSGYAARAEARYETSSGGAVGFAWSGAFFDTRYAGEGRRGPNEITGARVRDSFQTLSVSFSRGF